MRTMKLVRTFFMLGIAMALVAAGMAASVKEGEEEEELPPFSGETVTSTGVSAPQDTPFSLRGASRFLIETRNPRAYNCRKNPDICKTAGSPGSSCCRNKCVDLKTDHQNCGACGVKCKFTTACCRGECVYMAFDKRHCGRCNNRCKKGDYCIYGLCNYA